MKKVKVCACMMVKDEEKNLRRCLESIKDFCEYIVVVDTGSTDKTVDIAKEYTDLIYFHEWENDFSKHRNQSLSYAPNDSDWVLIIDADEELCRQYGDSYEGVFSFISGIDSCVNAVGMHTLDIRSGTECMRLTQARMFRYGSIRYDGYVHNQPIWDNPDSPIGFLRDLVIRHYGYDLSPEDREKKHNRSYPLLKRMLEDHPEEHSTLFYLFQFLAKETNLEEALGYGNKYYELRNEIKGFNQGIFYSLAYTYYEFVGDLAKTVEICKEGLKFNKHNIDLWSLLSDCAKDQQNLPALINASRRYILSYKKVLESPDVAGIMFLFTCRDEYYITHLNRLFCADLEELVSIWPFLRSKLQRLPENHSQRLIFDSCLKEMSGLVPGLSSNFNPEGKTSVGKPTPGGFVIEG